MVGGEDSMETKWDGSLPITHRKKLKMHILIAWLKMCLISWWHCTHLRYSFSKILLSIWIGNLWQAQNDTELSFDKNERLEIIDRPPSDPDWYKARNTSGQIGLVPKNYLIELSQYLTQDVNKSNGSGGNGNNGHININLEDIKGQLWYFGTISRAECDVLLSEKGMDGDFMIRESETNVSFISNVFYWYH